MKHGSENFWTKNMKTLSAGAIASLITQPFEVLKTNMINSPFFQLKDLHRKIIGTGWQGYMKGGSIAVMRQSYGFTIYVSLISYFNKMFENLNDINKYYRYSMAAFMSKWIAMIFEAPLTLLKTRAELLSSESVQQQLREISKDYKGVLTKGLAPTLVRQSVFSLVHYGTYRFLKDQVFYQIFGMKSSFIPAFIASMCAISLSQPFQVIRSRVTLGLQTSFIHSSQQVWKYFGWKGFYFGFIPRLCRKPINSGICWTILESFNQNQSQ